jgi:hypothetical protein
MINFEDEINNNNNNTDNSTIQLGSGIKVIDNENFYLEEISKETNIKFRYVETIYNLKIKHLNFANFHDILLTVENMFNIVVETIKSDPLDQIQIEINHIHLKFPIQIPLIEASSLTGYDILREFEKVIQSNQLVSIDENLTIKVGILKKIRGAGNKRKTKFYNDMQDFIKKSRSVVEISNNDNLCLFRSIAILVYDVNNHKDRLTIRRTWSKIQTLEAMEYAMRSNFDLDKNFADLNDLKNVEDFLQDYQFIVISGDDHFEFLYSGPTKNIKLFLLYYNNHFYPILSMPAFYNKKYYCEICFHPYDSHFEKHKCNANSVCELCKKRYCIKNNPIQCSYCLKFSNNNDCLIRHQTEYCYKLKICSVCSKFMSWRHVCDNQRWCKFCKSAVDLEHKCFIIKGDILKHKFNGYVIFDYETMIDSEQRHIPCLIVAQKICARCLDENNNDDDNNKFTFCEVCEEKVFFNNETFCEYLFKLEYFIVIAHNMGRFDGYFIMNYIINHRCPQDDLPRPLINGSRILCLNYKQIKILDSFNFIPMALSKFSKTFSLSDADKGYFPYLFNTLENQNYIGDIPNMNYYGTNKMSKDELDKFKLWYNAERNSVNKKEFNLKDEMIKYCRQDVQILKKGILSFRNILMNLDKEEFCVDPFLHTISIASYCHMLYRKLFMPENSIALIPEMGYNFNENQSIKAINWLKFISISQDLHIVHARNQGEHQINGLKVDGYCASNNTIYEFDGCYFHGCPKHFRPETINKFYQKPMKLVYEDHLNRVRKLLSGNIHYNYVSIWECDYDLRLKNDKNFSEIITQNEEIFKINPRDALYGGRVNAVKLYYEVKNNEKMRYYDFMSLYPSVEKYKKFPLGHPKIITENFKSIDNYFGICLLDISPPRNLFFPVLPIRLNGKLIFTLCNKCAQDQIQKCDHEESERMLRGTWTTCEIFESLKQNYKIKKILCVWHWESEACIETNNGLFDSYVNLFLKMKQESSGWPSHILNETNVEKKRELIVQYLNEFKEKEGVLLDESKIEKNEGMRAISKLMLNSHWGKYAQNPERTLIEFTGSHDGLMNILLDSTNHVVKLIFHNNLCQVLYSKSKDFIEYSNNTNVVIAAFVTSHARLKLYQELIRLNRRVVYFDTDSVIFIDSPAEGRAEAGGPGAAVASQTPEYKPLTGNFLGQLQDELERGDYIVEVCCLGPKSYCFKTFKGKIKIVVKGFTLHTISNEQLNFDSIKKILLDQNDESEILVDQFSIRRDNTDWSLKNTNLQKSFKICYDKRARFGFETLPFGF